MADALIDLPGALLNDALDALGRASPAMNCDLREANVLLLAIGDLLEFLGEGIDGG